MDLVSFFSDPSVKSHYEAEHYRKITSTKDEDVLKRDNDYMIVREVVNGREQIDLVRTFHAQSKIKYVGFLSIEMRVSNGNWVFSHYDVVINQPYDEKTDSDCLKLLKTSDLSEAVEMLWNNREKATF